MPPQPDEPVWRLEVPSLEPPLVMYVRAPGRMHHIRSMREEYGTVYVTRITMGELPEGVEFPDVDLH